VLLGQQRTHDHTKPRGREQAQEHDDRGFEFSHGEGWETFVLSDEVAGYSRQEG
jgi:hypothetical protein